MTQDIDNKNNYQLTLEKLRLYPGLETISDEEAENAINSIELLSIILYENPHLNDQ